MWSPTCSCVLALLACSLFRREMLKSNRGSYRLLWVCCDWFRSSLKMKCFGYQRVVGIQYNNKSLFSKVYFCEFFL